MVSIIKIIYLLYHYHTDTYIYSLRASRDFKIRLISIIYFNTLSSVQREKSVSSKIMSVMQSLTAAQSSPLRENRWYLYAYAQCSLRYALYSVGLSRELNNGISRSLSLKLSEHLY